MLKNPVFSVAFVTIYLVVYTLLLHTGASMNVVLTMFLVSPVLVLWMVYVVLKFGKFEGRELEPDQEWGYSDRKRESLGTF